MIQLILHGLGDYILQTSAQGLGKKKSSKLCFMHCLTYSLPFFLIGNYIEVFFIFLTHFIIDRWHLIEYFIAWRDNTVLYTYEDGYFDGLQYDISNFGFPKERPFAISFWLYVIIDNLCHITCNYLILKYI